MLPLVLYFCLLDEDLRECLFSCLVAPLDINRGGCWCTLWSNRHESVGVTTVVCFSELPLRLTYTIYSDGVRATL
jgi:hypothetical protein